MNSRIKSAEFVAWLQIQLHNRCGYIMGACGQTPANLGRNSWYFRQYRDRNEYTATQYRKALYWYDHAPRVFDCAGLAEGAVVELRGLPLSGVNTKARYIYADWCRGANGTDMTKLPRVPGTAVFKTHSSVSHIHHIGYLERPVVAGDTNGDWYVIEAKGVLYGVIRTRLNGGGWNCWGQMLRHFDYAEAAPEPVPVHTGDVVITGGSVNLRSGPGTQYPIAAVAHRGDVYPSALNPDKWRPVMAGGRVLWVSPKLSQRAGDAAGMNK